MNFKSFFTKVSLYCTFFSLPSLGFEPKAWVLNQKVFLSQIQHRERDSWC
jgi:hypothetical protein